MRSFLFFAVIACGGSMPGPEDSGQTEQLQSYACSGFVTCRVPDGGTAIMKTPYSLSRCGVSESEAAATERDSGVPAGCTKSASCDLGGDAGC